MKKKQFEIHQYYEAPVCDCGGIICIRDSTLKVNFDKNPCVAVFYCNKCGKAYTLQEADFPATKYHILFDKEIDEGDANK